MVNAAEARMRERWSKDEQDEPLVRLTNMILVTMVRNAASCIRVRSDGEPVIERYDDGAWTPFADFGKPPAKIREPIIWRLKFMAEIAPEAAWIVGARFGVVVGAGGSSLHDYDVCFSRSLPGSRIVVSRMPTRFGWRTFAEHVRRARILLAHADDATARDEVLARVREAIALVPEGDGARPSVLQTAAATCGRAGLFEEALSILRRALPIAEDARERSAAESTIGLLHEDNGELDEAATYYARALATAETIAGPHVYESAPLIGLGDVATLRGDFASAEKHLARAEALASDVFGVTSVAMMLTRPARVRLLRARGDAAGAESLATRELAIATRFELAQVGEELRTELAELALSRLDARAAVAHVRAILQVPSRHPGRARAYTILARALHSLGDDAEAFSALRAALALTSDVLASDHPIRVEVEREFALISAASPYR